MTEPEVNTGAEHDRRTCPVCRGYVAPWITDFLERAARKLMDQTAPPTTDAPALGIHPKED